MEYLVFPQPGSNVCYTFALLCVCVSANMGISYQQLKRKQCLNYDKRVNLIFIGCRSADNTQKADPTIKNELNLLRTKVIN